MTDADDAPGSDGAAPAQVTDADDAPGSDGAAPATAAYAENEWNYVEASIDAFHGIPADAEGVLADIRDAGVLRVATDPYFPPQEYIDDTKEGQDRYAGPDMELARLIAQRMGVDLEIVPMEFTEVLPSLEERTCDLAVSALSYVPERAERYTLSRGYHYARDAAGSGLLIRTEDAGEIRSVEDLAERTIAVQSGSLQEALAVDEIPDYAEYRRLPSIPDVYQALEDGLADAAVVDVETAGPYVEERPELTLVPDLRFRLAPELDGDRIAARKGEIQLIAFVNGVIKEVLASGQYEIWYQEALREGPTP